MSSSKRRADHIDLDIDTALSTSSPSSKLMRRDEDEDISMSASSSRQGCAASASSSSADTATPVHASIADVKMSPVEEGKAMPERKRDKGKGKMVYLPELPEEVWRRVWSIYYQDCSSRWHGKMSYTGALTPLLISPELTRISLPILYAYPLLTYDTITPFLSSISAPSSFYPDSIIPLIRNLCVQATPAIVDHGTDMHYRRTSFLHACLGDVLKALPQLASFTLKDTLILTSWDARALFAALKHIRPKKVRLELRMWDLHDSHVGQDLLAATQQSIHTHTLVGLDQCLPSTTFSSGHLSARARADGGTSVLQEAWRRALWRGEELDLPAWWIESVRPETSNPNHPVAAAAAAPAGIATGAVGGHGAGLRQAASSYVMHPSVSAIQLNGLQNALPSPSTLPNPTPAPPTTSASTASTKGPDSSVPLSASFRVSHLNSHNRGAAATTSLTRASNPRSDSESAATRRRIPQTIVSTVYRPADTDLSDSDEEEPTTSMGSPDPSIPSGSGFFSGDSQARTSRPIRPTLGAPTHPTLRNTTSGSARVATVSTRQLDGAWRPSEAELDIDSDEDTSLPGYSQFDIPPPNLFTFDTLSERRDRRTELEDVARALGENAPRYTFESGGMMVPSGTSSSSRLTGHAEPFAGDRAIDIEESQTRENAANPLALPLTTESAGSSSGRANDPDTGSLGLDRRDEDANHRGDAAEHRGSNDEPRAAARSLPFSPAAAQGDRTSAVDTNSWPRYLQGIGSRVDGTQSDNAMASSSTGGSGDPLGSPTGPTPIGTLSDDMAAGSGLGQVINADDLNHEAEGTFHLDDDPPRALIPLPGIRTGRTAAVREGMGEHVSSAASRFAARGSTIPSSWLSPYPGLGSQPAAGVRASRVTGWGPATTGIAQPQSNDEVGGRGSSTSPTGSTHTAPLSQYGTPLVWPLRHRRSPESNPSANLPSTSSRSLAARRSLYSARSSLMQSTGTGLLAPPRSASDRADRFGEARRARWNPHASHSGPRMSSTGASVTRTRMSRSDVSSSVLTLDDDAEGPSISPTSSTSLGRLSTGSTGSTASSSSTARLDPARADIVPRAELPWEQQLIEGNATSHALARGMRNALARLLQDWCPGLEALSFVAFDPLASLVVRAPGLDFWTDVPVPHIRVHFPRAINSLAVFKGAKECARDRARAREIAALWGTNPGGGIGGGAGPAGGLAAALEVAVPAPTSASDDEDSEEEWEVTSTDPNSPPAAPAAPLATALHTATNSNAVAGPSSNTLTLLAAEEDQRVVGGDGHGGGLVHPDVRIFEIEVNTMKEMGNEMWTWAGWQLPSVLCRMLVGQDWDDVRIGRSAGNMNDDDAEIPQPEPPASAGWSDGESFEYPSDWDEDASEDAMDGDRDRLQSPARGEGANGGFSTFDADAARAQAERVAQRRLEREGKGA